jgi:hypothetical protein
MYIINRAVLQARRNQKNVHAVLVSCALVVTHSCAFVYGWMDDVLLCAMYAMLWYEKEFVPRSTKVNMY